MRRWVRPRTISGGGRARSRGKRLATPLLLAAVPLARSVFARRVGEPRRLRAISSARALRAGSQLTPTPARRSGPITFAAPAELGIRLKAWKTDAELFFRGGFAERRARRATRLCLRRPTRESRRRRGSKACDAPRAASSCHNRNGPSNPTAGPVLRRFL